MQNKIDYKLQDYIGMGENEKAIQYMHDNMINVNNHDQKGWTYLHIAVYENNIELVDYLCHHDANINAQDMNGSTPLMIAVNKYRILKDDSMIKILIENGADSSIKANSGTYPVQVALLFHYPQEIIELLQTSNVSSLEIDKNESQNSENKVDNDNITPYEYSNKYMKKKEKDRITKSQLKEAADICKEAVELCQREEYYSAKILFEKAGEKGSSTAIGNLAFMHLNGNGVEKDEEKAFQLFLQAAEMGHTLAMAAVSEMYEKGIGTKKDLKKMEHWIKMSQTFETYNKNKKEITLCLDAFLEKRDSITSTEAEQKCLEIMELIPEPQNMFEEKAVSFFTLGNVFEREKDFLGALEAYRQVEAVTCNKSNALLFYRMGCCYAKSNNENAAKINFEKAYRLAGISIFEIDNDYYKKFVSIQI